MVRIEYLEECRKHPISAEWQDPWTTTEQFEWLDMAALRAGGAGRVRHYRDELVKQYAWAIPCEDALVALIDVAPLIEVGAGLGYWAYLLRQVGVDIVATDLELQVGAYTLVLEIDAAAAAAAHPDRTLFLCWPPYDTPMAIDALRAYRGGTVAYIGESNGGCTGSDAFHQLLEAEWHQARHVWLPQWRGIHDRLGIYRRGRSEQRTRG